MVSGNRNNSTLCTYRFLRSSTSDQPIDRTCTLEIRQQPQRAKMSVERDRRAIEPPPMVQVKWVNCSADQTKTFLQSPFFFVVANLIAADDPDHHLLSTADHLSGTTVSSLFHLRDIDNTEGGFFVFGDLCIKKQGRFRLHFSLFEIVDGCTYNRQTTISDVFTVYAPKQFPGPVDATLLSRAFSDQGVKMRIRKDHRLQIHANGRKRKLDVQALMDAHLAKSKRLSPPAYASSDVHFGRWQAVKWKGNPSFAQVSTPPSPPPSVPAAPSPQQPQLPPPPQSINTTWSFTRQLTPPSPEEKHDFPHRAQLPPLRSIMADVLQPHPTLPPLPPLLPPPVQKHGKSILAVSAARCY